VCQGCSCKAHRSHLQRTRPLRQRPIHHIPSIFLLRQIKVLFENHLLAKSEKSVTMFELVAFAFLVSCGSLIGVSVMLSAKKTDATGRSHVLSRVWIALGHVKANPSRYSTQKAFLRVFCFLPLRLWLQFTAAPDIWFIYASPKAVSIFYAANLLPASSSLASQQIRCYYTDRDATARSSCCRYPVL
jgi:hypothetical protein